MSRVLDSVHPHIRLRKAAKTELTDFHELPTAKQPLPYREVYLAARSLHEQSPSWATFYREVFGVGGLVQRHFPTPEEQDEFRQSDIYFRIHEMLVDLRNRAKDRVGREEPLRVITIRIPRSLHESLREEAYSHRTSMNKLCISKLLQLISRKFVPHDV